MPVQIKKGVSSGSLRMTPLIDVVFLLLIFFLVATRFEQEERDMDVKLPQASEAEPTIFRGKEVFVTVTSAGDYYVDGERHDAASLEARLASLYLSNPGRQRVTIRADEDSRTGKLVEVMNACNRANITNYNIATE
ncbi:MAG: biopolymer transporter ExbD [Planctomycetota bacterium]